ncbi:WD40 repeat domain-containing protein [Streptomyces sp. NPDC001833]|uniref:WD40 repeat domain-containing protein n=1 Tax=Streptomyces sp. NPDC001833 TaxID=3154658 RepID=UPI0033324E01
MGRREKPLDPDAGPVQRLAQDLRTLREKAGKPAYRAMAQRVPYSASALSQAAAGEQLPTLAVVRAYAEALDADAQEWEERWREADEAAREAAAHDGDGAPPYRGLARFEPYDSDLFFGRGELVAQLLELAHEHRFTAVSGPSGSGKSSLLRAGLIPALRTATGADRPAVIRVLTPGERPAHTHADALTPKDGELNTWVLVDQFEELFTLCRDRVERDRFLDLLLAAREADSRLRVVVAVRGDFYGHCAERRELAEAVSRAHLLVGPMSRDELKEVITGPATAAGLNVERALTARIIDEVTDQPGALPTVSHALLETWRRRRGRTLTVAAYEEAGGVRGAIAATAERLYAELSPAQARTARRILLRLIAPGDGTADTRRPAERAELGTGEDVSLVVERLAAARLITLNDDTVELSHEALITGWPRLAGWIDEDRERLREQRLLGEAARAWERLERDPGSLYRGTRLARAEELFAVTAPAGTVASQDDDLTRPERAFLTASLTARTADAEAEVRAARKTRNLTAALSAFLALALAAGLFAWQQSRESDREAAKAAARRIAAVADGLRATDPRKAALLGVAAWKLAHLTESRAALLSALVQPEQDAFTDPQTGKDTRRFLVGGGRTLVSVAGRRVSVWNVAGHDRTATYRLPGGTDVSSVSPDARIADLAGADGDQVWDLAAGKPVAELPNGTALLGYTADGNGYAVGPTLGPGAVQLRRLTDGKILFVTNASANLSSADLGADGRLLALCPADGPLQVWDTTRDKRLSGTWDQAGKNVCGTGTGADAGTFTVRLSPDGKRLAAISGTALRVWDIPSGRQVADLSSLGDTGFNQAAFSPDGQFLAGADDDGLSVWRLTDNGVQVFHRAPADTQIQDLSWDPDKDRLLRYLDGTTAHTYDLTANLSPRWLSTTSDTTALSPDGTTLASVTRTGSGYHLELRSTRTGSTLARRELGPLTTVTDNSTPLLAYSPDGTALAVADTTSSGGSQQRITIWDSGTHRVRLTVEPPGNADDHPVSGLALGPRGRTLLLSRVEGDRTVTRIWDTGGDRPRAAGTLPGLAGDTLAVRPDGRLAASSEEQTAALPSGPVTGRALADGRNITALAFSPDGSRLAVGDSTGRVVLWDGEVRHRTGTLTGASGSASSSQGDGQAVAALAFAPDGSTFAVAHRSGTAQLWDTDAQQLLVGEIPTTGDEIRSVSFSRDGGTLYVSGPHVRLTSHPISPEQAVKSLCTRTGSGGLTRADWKAYVPDVPYRSVCG